jgi:lipopolysaccharide/colanic/teichoic acid biosynthesis glycosyltransferase
LLKQHTPHFTLRTRITPGITGLAQLRSGYAATVEESQRKLEFDLYFMRTAKTSSALGIISGTAKKCGKEILSAFFAVLRRGNNRVN